MDRNREFERDIVTSSAGILITEQSKPIGKRDGIVGKYKAASAGAGPASTLDQAVILLLEWITASTESRNILVTDEEHMISLIVSDSNNTQATGG